MARLRATIHVHGTVQGVGFRAWARGRLEAGGLSGSAENRGDGTVEVVAVGPAEDVDRLVEDVRHDAPGSVEQVVVAVEELPDDEPRDA